MKVPVNTEETTGQVVCDHIVSQFSALTSEMFVPVRISLNTASYEQLSLYMMQKEASTSPVLPDYALGLPITVNPTQPWWVVVLCDNKTEFIYRDKLRSIRGK